MFDTTACWVAFAALFVACRLIPDAKPKLRAGTLALISIAAIVAVFRLDWRAMSLVVGCSCWMILATWKLAARPVRRSMGSALFLVMPVAALWMAGKISTALHGAAGWLFFLGSSFFLVKAFSLLRDRLEGKAPDAHPAFIAAYLLYFPTWFSGPMHNWTEFRNTISNSVHPRSDEVVDIVFRFVWGLFKVQVLAAAFAPSSLIPLASADAIPIRALFFGAIVYSAVLYFNFSGYSDMVIAASRVIGVNVPENFNAPYLSRSIRDFWRRWHITFSRALTAHLFIPFSRWLAERSKLPRTAIPVPGYLVTFAFAGFWHGSTLNFVLWGLYHGIGLMFQDLWQKTQVKRNPNGPAMPAAWLTVPKIFGTFLFVSMGWILFVLPVDRLARITW